jgi:hypothetical protein
MAIRAEEWRAAGVDTTVLTRGRRGCNSNGRDQSTIGKSYPATVATGGGDGVLSPNPAEERHQPMASSVVRKLPNFWILEGLHESGYDSDGLSPSKVPKEPKIAELEAIPEEEAPAAADKTPILVPISVAKMDKLSVATLNREPLIRGCPFKPTLKKAELKERLEQALTQGLFVSVFWDPGKKKKGSKRAEVEHI